MISLRPLKEFKLPIAAECISPDIFRGKKCSEIMGLRVWEGNRQKKLKELFKVEEVKTEDATITIRGNVSKVRRIGSCMTDGKVVIYGDVGMHLGEEMRGGKILVNGNVGSWVGSMMKAGEIEVHGNVCDYMGAPYRGSSEGMSGGWITVYGNVGNETGAHMKNGVMRVYGSAGQFVGFRMHNGVIYIQRDCAVRAGACMIGGKVIVGGVLESLLPTFTIDSVKARVKTGESDMIEGPFFVFVGDLVESGEGKLYVSKEKNPHLSHHEQLL